MEIRLPVAYILYAPFQAGSIADGAIHGTFSSLPLFESPVFLVFNRREVLRNRNIPNTGKMGIRTPGTV